MADSSAESAEPPLGLSALKLALALLDQASTYAPSWAYPPPPSSSNQVDAAPALKSVWSSLKWLGQEATQAALGGLEGTTAAFEFQNVRVRIRKKVAEGGYGEVYKVAEVEGRRRKLALKLCRAVKGQHNEESAITEMKMLQRFVHASNVVTLVAAGVRPADATDAVANTVSGLDGEHGADDVKLPNRREYLMLLEWCGRGTLADAAVRGWEKRHADPTPKHRELLILTCFGGLCQGLALLHAWKPAPIAHRDLKNENVLLGNENVWKLCDFGSASTEVIKPPAEGPLAPYIARVEEEAQRYTSAAVRAPEQCDAYRRAVIDERVDIWALGVCLWELMYGAKPFGDGSNPLAILNRSLKEPADAPKYSDGIKALVSDLLSDKPEDRPKMDTVCTRVEKLVRKAGDLECCDDVVEEEEKEGGGDVVAAGCVTPGSGFADFANFDGM